MNICLINPPYAIQDNEYYRKYIDSGYNTQSLGLGYIVSYLQNHDYDVCYVECMIESLTVNDVLCQLEMNQYDIVGISVTDSTRRSTLKLIKEIRKSISKNCYIILGGYCASLSYESLLQIIDDERVICVLGEGEVTMLELVQAVERGDSIDGIKGISYLENKTIKKTEPRSLIEDLNTLPFPYRVDNNRYSMSITSSRGCLNDCTYCSISALYKKCSGRKFRSRSAENIYYEIQDYIAQWGKPQKIVFYDDNFLASSPYNLKRIEKLCIYLRNVDIPFCITARAGDIVKNEPLIKKLKNSGLYHLFVGIESFSQRQLDLYNKCTSVEENLRAIQIIYDNMLSAEIGFIPLDKTTNIEEIRQNYSILLNSKATNILYKTGKLFSKNNYIFAVNGTKIRKLIEEEGTFVNNERGYKFDDFRVERLLSILKIWIKGYKEIENDMLFIYKLRESTGIFNKYYRLNVEMTRLDIQFIISVCEAIEKNFSVEKVIKEFELKRNKIKNEYILLQMEAI